MKFYTNVRQWGNKLLVREIDEGIHRQYEIPYSPYLFVRSNKPNAEYRSVFGEPCEKIYFDSIRDAKDFVSKYDGVSNFEFFGMTQYTYPFINDEYAGDLQYDSSLVNVVSIDIETMSDDGFPDPALADKAVTVITISDGHKFVVIGVGDFEVTTPNTEYINCRDERALLHRFLDEYKKMNPDVLTGWNIEFFDIPYLVNRIRKILPQGCDKDLSPWRSILDRVVKLGNDEIVTYDLMGVSTLDYMQVYKKFTFVTQESYRLDHIGEVELGMKKLDYSEYGSLHDLYEKNYQLYVEYNIRDTELINKLEEKLKLIDLVFAISYDAKINYNDAFTSVRAWDVIIHNYLINQKITIPQYKHTGKDVPFVGGFVKDPQVGKHDWVMSFDLNSLYPHLIMQYNISPETYSGMYEDINCSVDAALAGDFNSQNLQDMLKRMNLTITPNGCLWRRDHQGFLPQLMEKMYGDRSVYKKKMLQEKQKFEDTGDYSHKKMSVQYDMIQMAKKIQLNSAYGALGNQYFRWFNPAYAESITTGGQFSIRWIDLKVNEYLNRVLKTEGEDYVVASDTDSIYVNASKLVHEVYPEGDSVEKVVAFLDKVASQKLEPFIDKSYQDLATYVNAYQQKMQMKREAIADKGIWTGKKHYILNVYNNEGVQYNEPQLKIMGIEAVRSSTPNSCRQNIKTALGIIMNGTQEQLIDFVQDFRKEFMDMPFERVAFPRGLKGMYKYKDAALGWRKGTPIHVRGAFVFNRLIDQHKMQRKIERLRDGDKIKFCYLKLPNPTRENIISCSDELPREFKGIEQYIDYETQFEKAFEVPLKGITDVINWKLENTSTLEDFFS